MRTATPAGTPPFEIEKADVPSPLIGVTVRPPWPDALCSVAKAAALPLPMFTTAIVLALALANSQLTAPGAAASAMVWATPPM